MCYNDRDRLRKIAEESADEEKRVLASALLDLLTELDRQESYRAERSERGQS